MNSMMKAMETAAGGALPPHVQTQIGNLARQQAPMLRAMAEAAPVLPPGVQAVIEQQAKLLAPHLPTLKTIERISR